MFGRRPDGRRISYIDPIVRITPYLMPTRVDAPVMLKVKLDYELLARYIAAQSAKGEKLTFQHVFTAAYVRAVSQHPDVNRFIMNRQYYSRTACTTSFTMLKNTGTDELVETAVKVKYDLTDTVYDVRDRIDAVINANRAIEAKSVADKLAVGILAVPGLPRAFVAIIRLLDAYGLVPGALLDELPFHTGLFVTNMASIGMPYVYHHIYNFGSTSLFMSMGKVEREVALDLDGNVRMKRIMPVGITADERVCGGAVYSRFVATMMEGLRNPSILEKPPEKVLFDPKCEYHVPKVKKDEAPDGTSIPVQA